MGKELSHLYLDRDIPSEDSSGPEDVSPVHVPKEFKNAIRKAKEIAQSACRELASQDIPKQSAVDFWCDTLASLNFLERDIELVEENLERKI